ncbi:MAG: 50S ribosomal protein L15 [bacterium]
MALAKMAKIAGNKSGKKRVGRGGGSGKGFHTTGKGNKGQNARRGHGIPVGFEGGQVPLHKKMPRIRGFNRSYSKKPVVVNLQALNCFKNGDEVTPQTLAAHGLINKQDLKKEIKILGHGELKAKLKFAGVSFSQSAKKAVEHA